MRRITLAAAAALLLVPSASAALEPAAQARATGTPLTLLRVTVDRMSPGWSVPSGGGSATWNPPFGQATYRFPLPQRIPAAGASVTIGVSATAAPNSRFAPALGFGQSDVEIQGTPPFQALALAEPGESASASKTVKLVPRTYSKGATVKVVVGLQDGPLVTYHYLAEGAPPKTETVRYVFRVSYTRPATKDAANLTGLELAGSGRFTIVPKQAELGVSGTARVLGPGTIVIELHRRSGTVPTVELRVFRASYFRGDNSAGVDLSARVVESSAPCLPVGKVLRFTPHDELGNRPDSVGADTFCRLSGRDFDGEIAAVRVSGPKPKR